MDYTASPQWQLRCICQPSRWLHLERWIETLMPEELRIICTLRTALNHLCIANVSYFKPQRTIALHTDKAKSEPVNSCGGWQARNKQVALCVLYTQDGQKPPVLELHRALLTSMPGWASGIGHNLLCPKGASTPTSMYTALTEMYTWSFRMPKI